MSGIYWAIAYTKRRGKPIEPYIFEDTIRRIRKQSWTAWARDLPPSFRAELKRKGGAKAIKVKVIVWS